MIKVHHAVNVSRYSLAVVAVGLVAIGPSLAFSMTDEQCSAIKLMATEKSSRWQNLLGVEVPTSNRPGAPFQRQNWKANLDVEPFMSCFIREKVYRGGAPARSASCHFDLPTVPEKSAMTAEMHGRLLSLYKGLAGELAHCLGSKPLESTGVNDSATSRMTIWDWKLSPPQTPQPVAVRLTGWLPKVGAVVDGVRTSAHLLVSFE